MWLSLHQVLAGRKGIKKNSSTGLETLRYCYVLWIKVKRSKEACFFLHSQAALWLPVKTIYTDLDSQIISMRLKLYFSCRISWLWLSAHWYWVKNRKERNMTWLPFLTMNAEQVALQLNEGAHAALALFKSQKLKARRNDLASPSHLQIRS